MAGDPLRFDFGIFIQKNFPLSEGQALHIERAHFTIWSYDRWIMKGGILTMTPGLTQHSISQCVFETISNERALLLEIDQALLEEKKDG